MIVLLGGELRWKQCGALIGIFGGERSTEGIAAFFVEDLLPMLCIQGLKDFWERPSGIANISELVQAHSGLDWDDVRRRTKSIQAQRILYLGLLVAADILGAPMPPEGIRRARADEATEFVAAELQTSLLIRKIPHQDARRRFRFWPTEAAGKVRRMALCHATDSYSGG